MFKVGDYVMYKTEGVCRIEEITAMDHFPKDRQKKLYYVMSPLKDSGLKIYSAVDNTMIPRRPVMTEQEARNMVEAMADIPELEIENEKYREESYKKALKSCDCREWVRIVKTIWMRRQGRYAEGKKSTAIDDQYQKAAEALLLEELSVALHMSEEEVNEYIKSHMQ
ncbi:MAG: CarD family transcriptional regulator [Lachnospiraceae bacterium]|nr:CarD family transcriptional regulator [Lachnospiraceae bacterium]